MEGNWNERNLPSINDQIEAAAEAARLYSDDLYAGLQTELAEFVIGRLNEDAHFYGSMEDDYQVDNIDVLRQITTRYAWLVGVSMRTMEPWDMKEAANERIAVRCIANKYKHHACFQDNWSTQ